MGRETTEVFFNYFKTHTTPCTAVYDQKKRLKAVFAGEVHAVDLAKAAIE
jgi:hypothetical protein